MFNKRISKAISLALSALILFAAQSQGYAQEAGNKTAAAKPAAQRRRVARGTAPKGGAPQAKAMPSPTPVNPPVTLVNNAPQDYMSGEANVSVKGNQNPIVRLGLAQNGVNIIEFPAADSFFMIHPGNSDLVTFDEETAKLSKRVLVLRPGAAFVAPPPGSNTRGPSTSFGVQMQTGMVVTFLIYPVRDLSQNAHRCVVMYNREEVVAARRAAGLSVNLDGREPNPSKTGTNSVRLGDGAPDGNDGDGSRRVDEGARPRNAAVIIDVDTTRADERAKAGKSSKKRPKVSEAAGKALKEAVKSPDKIGKFSKSSHGLSVAVSQAQDLDAQTRLVVIAVRNDLKADLRVVPGNPELYVQTFDDNGRTLQLEQVKKSYVESTSLDGKLVSGGVAYFVVVYEAPILGAQQRLRVSVSQTEAADEPATAVLKSEATANR